ncbi:cell adhesion molecule Dscam2-like isoform X4 [Frankliniella occidentalis]|uniref:Cell adhesion molecule Dscam2-like isoform X4 n=1 Tax=Frankliniella occidentalis TaxID=133901 RepID=A0A9C6X4X1_FRAOC|nr:cell adhesion molecule Dscam2-like isoform X4 [Frankliniella occidentalis]
MDASGFLLAGVLCLLITPGDALLAGPSFQLEPPARVDFANDTGAMVDCVAVGSPPPAVSWLSEGKPVADVPGALSVLHNGSLHFLPFRASGYRHDVHAATYRCVAGNLVGRITSRDVRVHAVVLQDYVVQVFYNKNVVRGNTAILKCTIPSFVRDYITVISWLKDDSFNIYPSPKGEGKYHMLITGELLIRDVEEPDKYNSYQCRAVNRLTGATLLSAGKARLSVTEARAPIPPRPLEKVVTVHGGKDRTVVLPCFAEGNPPPTASWFRLERQQLRPHLEAPDERVFAVGEVLVVQHAEEQDAGHWVCLLNSTAGGERVDVTLQLSAPLSVSLQPHAQVTVDVGARTELRCAVSGGSQGAPPSRAWYKDGHPLAGASHATLVLDNVQREDAGMYQCVARADNDDSAQAATQLLLGAARPQLLYKFIRQTLAPGPHVSLKCIATGNPTPHISWNLDGFPLPQSDRFVIGQYMTLHGDVISHVNISNVQVEDGGIYQCVASNRVGDARHSADMRVYGPPHVRPMPNISAVAGEPLYIACPAAGYPIETITWEKDGRVLPLNRRQHVFPNGTLHLENVQRDSESGLYRCTASNKQGRSSTQGLELAVIVPPRWASEPRDQNVTRDQSVAFHCRADGFPQPVVTWRKIIGTQPSEYQDLAVSVPGMSGRHRGVQVFSNGTLLMKQALPDLQGQYMCEASNNIGAGVSAVVNLKVHIPPEFEVKSAQVSVRRGAPQTLSCQVLGDGPMTVSWQRDGRDSGRDVVHTNPRFEVKESEVKGGFLSELHISSTAKSDSGPFLCVATNPFGRAERVVHLQVQDAPGRPQDVRVLEAGSRQVKLTWLAPQDDRAAAGSYSPALQYSVQVQLQGDEGDAWRPRPAVAEQRALVMDLSPATVYRLRVVAENELGAGEPSDAVTVRTDSEAPAGEPQGLAVTAVASDSLSVSWGAPPRQLWHGEILGYYVGYREHGSNRPGGQGHNFSTVAARPDGSGSALLTGLKKYRKYGVVVQAFNEKGPGPMSQEEVAQTLEDVPGAPPQDIRCKAHGPQSLSVEWQAPPVLQQHGALQGYRVYYENVEEWPPGTIEADTKVVADTRAELHGLQRFSNYSVRVWAFTRVGDGVRSKPIYCVTEEDVPDAPADIKVVASSSSSLVVSWLPPTRPHGRLTGYTVYHRALDAPGGREQDSAKHRLPPAATSYEAVNLSKGVAYEFWATASTRVGEGHSTSVAYANVSPTVPAAVVSFGQRLTVRRRGAVSLPCAVVGVPTPRRSWSRADGAPTVGDAVTVAPDGTLRLLDAQRQHSANYTCTAANANGSDQIVYQVQVQVPPGAPSVRVASTSSSSVQLQWAVSDTGGSAIRGYLLNYRREEGEWEERTLAADSTSYRLTGLDCGSQYQLQMMAVNAVGSGPASTPLVARTDGGPPGRPAPDDFVEPNANGVTLRLGAWVDNGCPILSFSVQYREKGREEWLTAASSVSGVGGHEGGHGLDTFPLTGLWSGYVYQVRVGARSEAGVTQAEYEVAAASAAGNDVTVGLGGPDSVREGEGALGASGVGGAGALLLSQTMYLVYVTSLSLAGGVALALLVICIRRRGLRRRQDGGRGEGGRGRGAPGDGTMAMDNKHNLAQREQFYAAVQKGGQERIPEYAEDISPYATFHVATHVPSHVSSHLYHEERLAAMETLQLKSGNPMKDELGKMRVNLKNMKSARSEGDYSSSTDQWSEIGPCRPDRIPMQTLLYGGQGTESSTSPEQSPVPERRSRHHAAHHAAHHATPGRHRGQHGGGHGPPAPHGAPPQPHHGRRPSGEGLGRIPFGARLDPPSGFTDGHALGHEVSEAECDMDTLHRLKGRQAGAAAAAAKPRAKRLGGAGSNHFTIAV